MRRTPFRWHAVISVTVCNPAEHGPGRRMGWGSDKGLELPPRPGAGSWGPPEMQALQQSDEAAVTLRWGADAGPTATQRSAPKQSRGQNWGQDSCVGGGGGNTQPPKDPGPSLGVLRPQMTLQPGDSLPGDRRPPGEGTYSQSLLAGRLLTAVPVLILRYFSGL